MLRTILAVLFAVCYLIIGIPVLFVEWLIGKKNPHLRDISSLRMVQWAFRVICRICGVKTHRKRAGKCTKGHTGALCSKPQQLF